MFQALFTYPQYYQGLSTALLLYVNYPLGEGMCYIGIYSLKYKQNFMGIQDVLKDNQWRYRNEGI